ncbi:MAG: FIST C-terminal domain-containing protein, partial [Dehalococcoidia bacterium]|nr:FIST C-terminal domain-containing protein [Dehalococcoidia bacterium]
NGWLVFADPFTTDALKLVNLMTDAYPGVPLIGGLASGGPPERGTRVALGTSVFADGAVLLAVSGDVALESVVAQGAQPIGEPWTITRADRNIVFEIGGRPALSVLAETVDRLSPADRERARRNLLIGLALDEYRATYRRGDFLIRNLIGVDPRSQAIAINETVRVGQTVQFQLRDAVAADADLRDHLAEAAARLAGDPIAVVLCACNGRGRDLFGAPDHDAAAIADQLAPAPLAGFFANGEIGPVGRRNFVHGFTASLAIVVRRAANGSAP